MPSLPVRASAGTLREIRLGPEESVRQRTAYLLLGDGCRRSCAYCPQARGAAGPAGRLGRVTWSAIDYAELASELAEAFRDGRFSRLCLQAVESPAAEAALTAVLRQVAFTARISVSAGFGDLGTMERTLAAGAERLGLSLDAVNARVAAGIRPGWPERRRLLREAARRFPGRVTTHLVIGLGETEREAVEAFRELLDEGVTIGLFAFRPLPGTRLGDRAAPDLAGYRRLQAALHLLESGKGTPSFDRLGRIRGFGTGAVAELPLGRILRTRGCPDCDRPYYDGSPRETPYNFHRPPTANEEETERERLLR